MSAGARRAIGNKLELPARHGQNDRVIVGRRNWTIAGSDRGWSRAWIADVLARLPEHICSPIASMQGYVSLSRCTSIAAGYTPADQAKALASKRPLGSGPLAAAIDALCPAAASGWYVLGGRIEKPAGGRASFDRGSALRQSLRRSCSRLFRRRDHRNLTTELSPIKAKLAANGQRREFCCRLKQAPWGADELHATCALELLVEVPACWSSAR